MIEEIREVLLAIEQSLTEADNRNDQQCNDMTLNHLKIANNWQKLKVKKPPDKGCCGCCSNQTACGRKDE